MKNIIYYGISQNRGGIENYILRISQNLDNSLYRIYYIDENEQRPCMQEEFQKFGEFCKITPRRKGINKNRRELDQLFREKKFDILHFNVNTLSYVEPIYAALRHGCKVLLHSRNAGNQERAITLLLHRINQFLLPDTKDIFRLAVSREAGEWLFKKNNYQIIHNGIDISNFSYQDKKRDRIRNEWNIGKELLIGNIGIFLPVKNQKFVLEIFRVICDKRPKSRLILVGEGPQLENCKEYAKHLKVYDNVIFTGRRDDVQDIYSALDVLLFPSMYEGFPNVVLEAQTAGLPCCISDVITPEVVLFPTTERISLNKTAEEWAKKLLEKDCTIDKRKSYAARVEQMGYSHKNEIKRIEKIYNLMS